MIEFKSKTKKELVALTPERLKAYLKAERKRYYTQTPNPCDCGHEGCTHQWNYVSQEDKDVLGEWSNYISQVSDILKEKEADVEKA